jgi:hypothetical protein
MTAPSQLFHCYPERAKAIFREWRLWFSALTDLNDPFEGMPSFHRVVDEIVEAQLRKDFVFQHPASAPSWPAYWNKKKAEVQRLKAECQIALQEKFRAKSAGSFRFFCLTGNKPDIAMWGHYADCHRGFAVEFYPGHPLFHDLKEVHYQKNRPEPAQPGDFRYLQVKDESWRTEGECRLIKRVRELEEGERLSDNKRLRFIPLPSEAVKAVYFGWQMPQETMDQMTSDLGVRPIQKFVMLPHTSEYALDAIPIDKVMPLADDIRRALGL